MKRGRNQRRRQGMNVNRALDSNGPDVRIRGTANQIYDKYLALARDANSSGDRVKAENYLQHAEHYFRMIRAMQPQMPQPMNGAGEGPDADADQPGVGEDRRFSREQQRFDQPQPSYGAEDDEDDVAPPPSRFDGPSFGDEQGEHRRPEHHARHDNRGDRQDRGERQDHRGGESRGDSRGEPRGEGRPEHRGDNRPDFRSEGGEGGFNDRRGRRRRRPRPPMGGEPRAGDAPEAAGGDSDEAVPETV